MYKHSSCLKATLNTVPLCSLVCVVWGHFRLPLCLESTCGPDTNVTSVVKRKDDSEYPSFQFVPFFIIKDDKDGTKQACLPPSFCDLDKRVFLWLSDLKSRFPDLSRGPKASSFLLEYFWLVCSGIVLCRSNPTQMCCQKLCISLTDARCTSSLCFVPWFELLLWSNSVYFCLWVCGWFYQENSSGWLYQCT